ncbi:hypothetical protein N0V90_008520 [Kalmusia sp. IMI 367209]|nr:hypothetical protein N0V90_008520 [Kalmusia sp. IMI 367209]
MVRAGIDKVESLDRVTIEDSAHIAYPKCIFVSRYSIIRMAKKRTRDGREKARDATQKPRPEAPSSTSAPGVQALQAAPQAPTAQAQTRNQKRKKLPRLPQNASISKRPLHHPAIPTPFASAAAPKTLYITAKTPFVPTLKRIRRLLLEIEKRRAQSLSSNPRNRQQRHNANRKPLQPNGRLAAADVEREIASEGKEKEGSGSGIDGEEVYVKATGRAIERALRIGVYFQGESGYRVRVETGSVMAIDDIEVKGESGENGAGEDVQDDEENVAEVNQELEDDDIPDTRIRMVSSITVAIGF